MILTLGALSAASISGVIWIKWISCSAALDGRAKETSLEDEILGKLVSVHRLAPDHLRHSVPQFGSQMRGWLHTSAA